MRLIFYDQEREQIRVVEDLALDYEADARIEESRQDHSVVEWELWDTLGVRASWYRYYDEIILDEATDQYAGKAWDQPANKWKEPWGWSYKHPELPEWRCRASDFREAVLTFKQAWATARTRGRLSGIKGKFQDGAVYKREKGARKLRRKGLPGEDGDHN